MERTIAAISTPQGNGGIAVIRISGNDAVKVADKVFFGSKKLADCDTHTVHYGFIKNEKGEKVDEVLATVMLAPKNFYARRCCGNQHSWRKYSVKSGA
mgnify:CR=1 FL=1